MAGLLQFGKEGLVELVDVVVVLEKGLDLERVLAREFLLPADDGMDGAGFVLVIV